MEALREKPVLLFIVIFTVGWGIHYGIKKANHTRMESYLEFAEGEDSRGPEQSDRVKQIRSLQYQEPGQALELIEAVQANPADDAEQAAAEEMLPTILNVSYHNQIDEKKYEEAKQFLDRLAQEAPDHFQYNTTNQHWGRTLIKRWHEATKAGEEDQAKALAEEIFAGNYVNGNASFLRDLQKTYIERWQQARKAGNAEQAEQHLRQAAQIMVSAGSNTDFVRVLQRAGWNGRKIYDYAEKLVAEDQAELAGPFYQAAFHKFQSGRRGSFDDQEMDRDTYQSWEKKIQAKTMESLVQAGDNLKMGRSKIITTQTPREIYRDAA